MAWEGWSRKSLSLLLIVSLAFNAGVAGTFGYLLYDKHWDGKPRWGARGPHHGKRLWKSLDLSPEQEKQLETAGREKWEQHREMRRQMREHHDDLAELLAQDDPDMEAVRAEIEQIAQLRVKAEMAAFEHLLDLKEVLTDDQQDSFNQIVRRAFSRGGPGGWGFGKHRGPRGKHGHGRRGPSCPQEQRCTQGELSHEKEN